MSKYYEVLVELKIESESPKGGTKVKKVKESYLVDALSVTEAEARVVKSFSDSGFSQDYSVVSVRGSKIVDVITSDEKPKVKASWKRIDPSEPLKNQIQEEDEA
jgi:hypothetical protein